MQGTVDGITYRYRDGDGIPLVLLHGWLGSKHSWQQVIDSLAVDNPILTYDQRCHGDSVCSPFDLTTLAADLEALLQHLDITSPVLAGHSLGGMVALKHTAIHRRPHAAFLAGTCATTPDPADGSPRSFREELGDRARDEWAAAIAANYCPENAEMREVARRELQEAETDVLRHGLQAIEDYDVRDDLDGEEMPAVVVAASRDRAVTSEKTQELAGLIGASHVTIDSSHLMLQERPDHVAAMLDEFVQEIDPAAG